MRSLLVAALLGLGTAPVTQDPIELSVRHPAHAVRILGTTYVVHELWITSRAPGAISLSGVTVLSEGGGTLVDLREAELAAHIGRPGLPRTHPTPRLLESGHEAVVYFWTPLGADVRAPLRLAHRVTVSVDGSSTLRPVTVSGGATRVAAADDAEVLDAPLRGPGWVAVYDPAMAGGHRTAIYTTDGKSRVPGRFAIDWIRLPPEAARMDPSARPPDWNGFGAEVLAVRDARVAAAVDGHPDAGEDGKARVSITRENAPGNYIALDLGNSRFAFYEHLQEGSVGVKAGDRVTAGQVIARVGSSGSVSSGPHLHFHVSDANSPLGAEGLPFVLRAFRVRGAFASIGAFMTGNAAVPLAIEPDRLVERPAPNAIVDFPIAK